MTSNLRSYIRRIVLDFLSINSKPQKGIHILNGHRVCLGTPPPYIFYDMLKELSLCADLISFTDAVEMLKHKTSIDRPYVAFSFDDGLEECYTHISPVLDEFAINGAFFINPNFVDGDDEYIKDFTSEIIRMPNKRPMRWNQIVNLHNNGHIIGAHTLDHIDINHTDIDLLESQIGGCKMIIENKINSECHYFAFPFGKLSNANSASIDIAKKYYKYIFSQSDYKNYYSFGGTVINRRHFEPDWPTSHVKYFLSCNKH